MRMRTEYVATLGPVSMNQRTACALRDAGATIIRLNGAHIEPDADLDSAAGVAIVPGTVRMLDLPGQKVRTEGARHMAAVMGDRLPFLTERDTGHIQVASSLGIEVLGSSYVRDVGDLEALSDALPEAYRPRIMAKLETRRAVDNLDKILDSNVFPNLGFILDRGDLIGNLGVDEYMPAAEKIMTRCVEKGRPLIVATQLLMSMCEHPVPHISEMMELVRMRELGVRGYQLSEETAIGKYPVEAMRTLVSITC